MLKKIALFTGIPILLLALAYGYARYMGTRLPDNRPQAVCGAGFNPGGKKVVVCIGDSITHGTVSENYVDMLASRLGGGYIVVNAGINSELAYNALQRTGDAARCAPDYVTVLIGTNDANAAVNDENADRAVKNMKLPRRPDMDWYRYNLSQICRSLKMIPHARIALLSLPPIGEDSTGPAFKLSADYSAVVMEVARRENVAYLPLHERMTGYLAANAHQPKHPYSDLDRIMYFGIFDHYILRRSYDDISRHNGFLLVTDFLHLNSRGAGMAADLIEGFVKGK